MLRIVDPITGHVLGRGRALENSRQTTKGILDNNAQRFKDLFGELGAKLIFKGLKDIGLTSE